MFPKRFPLWFVAVLLPVFGQHDGEWTSYGRDPGGSKYSPLAQINRDNVTRLRVAWTYDSHDAFKGSEMQSNPVVVDGVLFATTPTLKVVAVQADTGREIWKSGTPP